jgi:O-antigen ligase
MTQPVAVPIAAGPGLVSVRRLSDVAVWLAAFSGGFVLWEPSPFELACAIVIPVFFLAGLPVRRSSGWLLALALVWSAGGFLSATQVSADLETKAFTYVAITLFLGVVAVWFAALVADDPRRLRVVEAALVASGLVVATVGVLAYFRLLPGADQFLLYGRARSTFKDPNVFGPYLVLPCLILARRLMTGPVLTRPFLVLGVLVLSLGVFLSFSRAAWGLLVVTHALLAIVVAATAPWNRDRLRLAGFVVAGVACLVVLVAAAASIPAVEEILTQRARLVQDYDGKDGAELGRFARHWAGFAMATELPLGLGPFEFPRLFVEATHNSYLKAAIEYGWLGFAAYLALVVATVRRALPLLIAPSPWQGFAQCVAICFIVHLAVGWLIDTDHWRQVFVMIGLIWGMAALDGDRRNGNRSAKTVPRVNEAPGAPAHTPGTTVTR